MVSKFRTLRCHDEDCNVPISSASLVSFGLIWLGVLLFCSDLWLRQPAKA